MKTAIPVPQVAERGDLFLAIDLHARHSVLGVMDAKGRFLGYTRFPTTERSLAAEIRAIPGKRKHLVLEECPMTHWAMGVLRPHVATILSCDPRENRLISRNSRKRDELDVQNLCRLLRLGDLREVYHTTDDDRFAFRALVQSHRGLQRDLVRAKNKIKAIYRRLGIVATGEPVYSKAGRRTFLEEVPGETWRRALCRAYRHHDTLSEEVRDTLREIQDTSRRYPEIAEFRKIPGVGPVCAAVFSAFIQTPHRFASRSKLHRYCRLSVTDRSSDGKPLGYRRLDGTTGSTELKDATYHAWLGAISSKTPNEVKYYHEAALEQNGGNQSHARLTTQRKIITVVWSLWKHNASYDPDEFIRMPAHEVEALARR